MMKELRQELKRKTQFMLWVQPGGTKVLKTTHSINHSSMHDRSYEPVETLIILESVNFD
jgi:hypothetical protein